MNDLSEVYQQLKGELPGCPPAETIRRHAEGRLKGDEARRVALHFNDCASCVGLLERLDPSDPPDLPLELQEEMAGEIGRRLGFEVEEPAAHTESRIGRLLRFKVPALVPVAVAALALAMFWWVGGGTGPSEGMPPVVRQLPIFTIDQTLARSGETGQTVPAVSAGEPFVLEIFLDRLDLAPGDRLTFVVTDGAKTVVIDGETAVLEDYNVRLALTVNRPGAYTVVLTDQDSIELLAVKVEVLSAG
jgi:hypothetical protein